MYTIQLNSDIMNFQLVGVLSVKEVILFWSGQTQYVVQIELCLPLLSHLCRQVHSVSICSQNGLSWAITICFVVTTQYFSCQSD